MVKVVIDGTTGFYQENVGLNFSGDYFQWGAVGSTRPVAGTISTNTAAVPSSGASWTPTWAVNGNMEIWTGLYKVTLDHDGNSSGGTDLYYKMGEEIKAGTGANDLQGNWYIVDASSVKTAYTKASDPTDYAKFQSTKDVVMSDALKDKTIYDHYYNIKVAGEVADNTVGTKTPIDEYVIAGTNMTAMTGTGAGGATLKDVDGTYVATTSGKITTVDRDFDIASAGYMRLTEDVTVTGFTGMGTNTKLVAKVAPNTYVKAGDKFTITFTLEDVDGVKASDIKIAAGTNITVGTQNVTTSEDIIIVKANERTLNTTSIEIEAPASMSTGAVAITVS